MYFFTLVHCTSHFLPTSVVCLGESQLSGVGVSLITEHPEKASIGGDSVASSEYETVSLFEETGQSYSRTPWDCVSYCVYTIVYTTCMYMYM